MGKNTVYYYRQIVESLKKGSIEPVYFIYGDEYYLVDSLIDQICAKFLGKAEKEMNYYLRYVPDNTLDDVLALTAGSGLFSDKKLIVLKDFQNLRNPNLQNLQKYLKNPAPDICLIIVARVDSVNQAKYKSLQEYTRFVNVLPLREAELEKFIKEEFAKYQKKISLEAVRTLMYLVGEKIHDLQTEIAQVANYYRDKTDIEASDIEKIVGIYVNQNVFELTRTIAQKNLEKSLFTLHNLLEKGENPGSILFFLLRHIMMLWKIRGFRQSGISSDKKIQEGLKLYSRQYNEYAKELQKWKMEQLTAAINLINESDQLLKSSQMPPGIILDALILKLIKLD
jgi:DNA polymerase-3 subunit delta